MLEPFSSFDGETCRAVVEVKDIDGGDYFTYDLVLEMPRRQFINMGELKALKAGLFECYTRMTSLIEDLEGDDDDDEDPGEDN